MRFPLQSIESSEFNEVVQIDHQKICMTDNGYNQVLVMIDHFTKYAEAVPCITASAEETCDHLINTWIARHGCPMTFQSDNGTAFVGELTKELMRRSQVAQAHSTTYHPQTNGLVERQNRTLVSMLRVYCSRYMTDWDRYLPQVMGAYNSTKHSAGTGKAEEKIRQESSWCKGLLGGRLRMGIPERYTTERDKKAPKKMEGTLHDYRGASGGTLL